MGDKSENIATRIIGTAACVYEAFALSTRKVPSISSIVWRLPFVGRVAVALVVAAVVFDHFVTRRYT